MRTGTRSYAMSIIQPRPMDLVPIFEFVDFEFELVLVWLWLCVRVGMLVGINVAAMYEFSCL